MFAHAHDGACVHGNQSEYPYRWVKIKVRDGEGVHEGESLVVLEGWSGEWWVPTVDVGDDTHSDDTVTAEDTDDDSDGEFFLSQPRGPPTVRTPRTQLHRPAKRQDPAAE